MKIRLLLLFVLAAQIVNAQQDPKQVLFLGNSYTFFNNLPQMFEDFSNAAGDTTETGFNTPGGFTLQGHTNNQMSLDMINQGNWDYVVLQEQSQIPSFPIGQVQTQCFPYATALDTLINNANPCAETVFYMTWGRENGDAGNCANWPPVCTYEGMDSLLYERYIQMAEDNEAIVSPVGAVWRYIRSNLSAINLYDNDGSHPSAAGSYAAACAFYAVIHRKNPADVPYDHTLNALEAYQIRQVAKLVVFDSLEKWFVGAYDSAVFVDADFESAANELSVSFNNTSLNATNYHWDFGDGTTTTDQHPYHTYSTSGTYTVTLTAFHCDSSDTAIQTLMLESIPVDTTIDDTTINDSTLSLNIFQETTVEFYPNPANESLWISTSTKQPMQFKMYNTNGAEVRAQKLVGKETYSIDVNGLPRGLYISQLRCNGSIYHEPIVIQ